MKCPSCKKEDVLIKINEYYICEICTKPKFKIEDIESKFVVSTFDSINGYRILINSKLVNGLFKVTHINNKLVTDTFKKSKVINEYKLVDADGVGSALVSYIGDYQKHYQTFLQNGRYSQLKKDEITFYEE